MNYEIQDTNNLVIEKSKMFEEYRSLLSRLMVGTGTLPLLTSMKADDWRLLDSAIREDILDKIKLGLASNLVRLRGEMEDSLKILVPLLEEL